MPQFVLITILIWDSVSVLMCPVYHMTPFFSLIGCCKGIRGASFTWKS